MVPGMSFWCNPGFVAPLRPTHGIAWMCALSKTWYLPHVKGAIQPYSKNVPLASLVLFYVGRGRFDHGITRGLITPGSLEYTDLPEFRPKQKTCFFSLTAMGALWQTKRPIAPTDRMFRCEMVEIQQRQKVRAAFSHTFRVVHRRQ